MTLDELRQLDRDPSRWPLPVRLAAIGLFFLVFAGVMSYFLVWNTRKDELAQFQHEEQKLRDEFRNKHGKAVNLELYKQQLADINANFNSILQQLPGRTEMPNLLVDISQTGSAVGLRQLYFFPQPEESKDFYAEKSIKITLAGSYHQLGEFVSGIAALPRIVTLHNVAIKAVDKATGSDQLQMDVTAKTYRYLDDAEVAAVEAAKKKSTAARGSSS